MELVVDAGDRRVGVLEVVKCGHEMAHFNCVDVEGDGESGGGVEGHDVGSLSGMVFSDNFA